METCPRREWKRERLVKKTMKKDKKYYLGRALFVYCIIPFILAEEFWAWVNKLFKWSGKAEVPKND